AGGAWSGCRSAAGCPMQWLSGTPNFNFMGHARLAMAISISLLVISIVAIFVRGLNLGLDFTGGVLLEVRYAQPVALEDVRTTLERNGYQDAIVQSFGTTQDVLIRLPPPAEGQDEADAGAAIGQQVLTALRSEGRDVNLLRNEVVGS